MKFITDLIKYFVYITTGILFVFIAILLINGSESISVRMIVQIPFAALATALITVIICSREVAKKKEHYIIIAIHYFLLCVTMVALGTVFEWIKPNFAGIMTIVISTAAIYAFTYTGAYLSSKSEAEKLNKALKSKREQRK
ncbi:MAG: DUF3021 domain-containing protein [Oscillospiraceae bacterium]|nr:DUF3021 domain-containing protein [Oscillospiraceae bacterium]